MDALEFALAMAIIGLLLIAVVGSLLGRLYSWLYPNNPQYHICIWKLKADADVDAIRRELATWKKRIPGIIDLVFDDIYIYEPTTAEKLAYAFAKTDGYANRHAMLGFTHSMVITFDSIGSRVAYGNDRTHLEFSKLLMPSLEGSESVFSFDSTPRGL